MRDFAALLTEIGCTDVATYIQSGNAVCTASPACANRLPAELSRRMAAQFGFKSPVIIRSASEMQRISIKNPFLKSEVDPATLHVAFLANKPTRQKASALDPQRSPGDSFALRGSELYLQLNAGVAKSKFTNSYFDSTLDTTSTMRNWRTVLALTEMAAT
jgi:uncharacterized protein (DUF1697 family)